MIVAARAMVSVQFNDKYNSRGRSTSNETQRRARRSFGNWKHATSDGSVVKAGNSNSFDADDCAMRRRILLTFGVGFVEMNRIRECWYYADAAVEDKRSLTYKLQNRTMFKKEVFNKEKPAKQMYPDFLLGEWATTIKFTNFEFPSDSLIDRRELERSVTTPGFQKLSIAYLPDVGVEVMKYRTRFVHDGGDDGVVDDRACVEDRGFNLREIFNAYLKDETAVASVDYDSSKNPNRTTVTLRRGAANNAERIELFTNARASEQKGGITFIAAETVRQVSLGYSVDFNTARVINYDYEMVWEYTPLRDDKIAFTVEDSRDEIARCNFVDAKLTTIGYLQSDDAMRATAKAGSNGSAPIPSLFDAGKAAYAPAVIYQHSIIMERVGCVP